MLACLVTLAGTYAACVMLFPANPTPRGALAVPGAVLAASIIAVPLLRVAARSPSAANSENIVAFGFVLWLLLDLIQGAYDLRDASDEGLRLALAAVGISAAAMWLGTVGTPWRLPPWALRGASVPLPTATIESALPICLVLGMFNFMYSVDFDIPELFSYLGRNRWDVPWGRGQAGGWDAFRDQTPYFGYVLPSLTAIMIKRKGLLNFWSLFGLAASTMMLLFLGQGGGRRIIGVMIGAALIVWVQLNRDAPIKNMIVIGLGAVALAWTAQFMLTIRTVGYAEYSRMESESELDYLHIDDNFLRLAQIIDIVPRRRPYVGARQVTFTLIRPVPRALWPGKPTSPGFDLPSEVGLKGVSLSSSIVGEWYLSWGWIAVVVGGWFHGRLAAMVNEVRVLGNRVGNPVIFGLCVMVLLAGMRSMQDLVLMSYALVTWWAVSSYLDRRRAA